MSEVKDITACDYKGRDNEPCYGKIESWLNSDSNKWVTFCEGHQGVPYGGFYVPRDPLRRWIFSQQNKKIKMLEDENAKLWEMIKYADRKLQSLDVGEIEIPAERLEVLYND